MLSVCKCGETEVREEDAWAGGRGRGDDWRLGCAFERSVGAGC